LGAQSGEQGLAILEQMVAQFEADTSP